MHSYCRSNFFSFAVCGVLTAGIAGIGGTGEIKKYDSQCAPSLYAGDRGIYAGGR